MIRFYCDYTTSAHPRILTRLQELADVQHAGYGTDDHCQRAAEYIRAACAAPDADVHFLVGGTQTNTTLISAILRPHQGVVSADSGHIANRETGAIESTGHKVLTLPTADGKLTAQMVRDTCEEHWSSPVCEHAVQPGMVYISHPSECGTLYTKAELAALSEACKERGLPLMLDGARLGYGLAEGGADTDLTLQDIARLCDVFYIGGTKVGALFGEAVVITDPRLKPDFRYLIKRHGGLLAKGFLLGIQFECLFEDDLYMQISRHGVGEALRLRQGITDAGFSLRYEAGANLLFPQLPDKLVEELEQTFTFARGKKPDTASTVVRFCTSWATRSEDVDALIGALKRG